MQNLPAAALCQSIWHQYSRSCKGSLSRQLCQQLRLLLLGHKISSANPHQLPKLPFTAQQVASTEHQAEGGLWQLFAGARQARPPHQAAHRNTCWTAEGPSPGLQPISCLAGSWHV